MIKMIKNLLPISQLLIFDKILKRRMRARHEIWQFTIPASSPFRTCRGIETGGRGGCGGRESMRQGKLACILERRNAQQDKMSFPFFQVDHGSEWQ